MVHQFSNMQKIILKSILGYDHMDELTWIQAQFAIKDGGLGLNHLDKIRHAAYVSSILVCREELSVIFPNLVQNMTIAPQLLDDREPPDIIVQFQSSVAKIAECSEEITLENIFQLTESHHLQLQSRFTEILTKNLQQELRRKFETDTKHLAWYQSVCGPEAGLWLSTLPKTAAQKMTNKEYQIALCYRLFLEQPLVINGCRCDCKNHPLLDLRGHHLMTGCGKHGYRHATHDGLVTELHQILNYLGIRNRVEETRCFQLAHPDSNRRPDISILPGPFTNTKIVTDIQVTCPVSGAGEGLQRPEARAPSVNVALQTGRMATKAAQHKTGQYEEICRANGLGFKPLIFESTGLMHGTLIDLLNRACQYASDVKKIGKDILFKYVTTLLSVRLQKSLAQALIQRTYRLASTAIGSQHHHLSYQVITNAEKSW